MKHKVICVLFCLLFVTGNLFAGNLRTGGLFSNNAVLQAEKEVPVWGTGSAGQEVTVEFAGQTKSVKADANGYWLVKLSPLKMNKQSAVMTISSGKEKIAIKNILVGEVWLCAGQSNMQFDLIYFSTDDHNNHKKTKIYDEMIKADFPMLRQGAYGRWVPCTPKTASHFTATGFFFGRELVKELDCPVGLIYTAVGGSPIEGWITKEAFSKSEFGQNYIAEWEKKEKAYDKEKSMAEYKTLVEKWQAEKDKAKKEGKPFKKRKPYIGHYRSPATYSQYPGSLFNRLINPFLPYAIAGVVWYQGESNGNKDAKYYESTFKAMIQDWRKRFGQGDIPFYYVQLPNLGHKTTNPYLSDWGIIREAQRKTLELPNTGMAVTIDIGEDNNIHPHNKIEVGKRLARWALNKNYGQEKLVYSGPLYKSAKAENGKLIITFDEAGSGLMVGKKADMWAPVEKSDAELAQFFVAGKDEVFKPAKAKITGKDTVEVWAESIKEPVYIRFGTAKNPVGINLYNKEGLPASPFYNK